jgi:FkbM family methyltransferase
MMGLDMKFSHIVKLLSRHFIRAPLYLIPRDAVVPIIWGQLAGKKWVNGSGIFRYWLGFYEYDKQKRFVEYVKPGCVVFDIGANVGYYTLLASKLVGGNGEVICFEPEPVNLMYLKKHIAMNAVGNAKVIEAAVSDRDGEVSFRRGDHETSTGRISSDGQLKVPSVTIDSLVGSGSIPPPAFLKIDIEGAEYHALCGTQKTLIAHHPIIFLATHGPEVHAQCCEFLSANGYTLHPLDGLPLEKCDEIICIYNKN